MARFPRKAALDDSPEYREMYDAADPSGIPRTAKMVACYVDGFEWADRAHTLFPAATVVTIAVSASDDADVLDVEPGAATIFQVRGWVKRQLKRGVYRPTIYCTPGYRKMILPLIVGLKVDWWIAAWTGRPYTLPYAEAVQYASNPHFDSSLVKDPAWPRRKPPTRPVVRPVPKPPSPPAPGPKPTPPRPLDDSMLRLNTGKHAETIVAMPGGATGLRIAAATTASLLVEFPGHPAHAVTVSWSSAVDLPLPRNKSGRPVREVKIVRADTDIDGDVAVAAT